MKHEIPGLVLLNKPAGPTSHDMVDLARKAFGEKCIGHAGTLDPFASGLLIILVGKPMTRRQSEFMHLDKSYRAVFRLGQVSDTGDPTGNVHASPMYKGKPINRTELDDALKYFIGKTEQLPHTYSAVKINGRKAYELARSGIIPSLKPKTIIIRKAEVLSYEWPDAEIEIECSSGTYIRSLAEDLGKKIGCGAYVLRLERTKIGGFSLSDAIDPNELTGNGFISAHSAY